MLEEAAMKRSFGWLIGTWRRTPRSIALVVWAALVLLAVPATAAPTTMSFEGALRTQTGTPAPDGSYSVQFSLYSVNTGGSSVWSETTKVAVKGGRFRHAIGTVKAVEPTVLANVKNMWLGMKVGVDPELPRMQLRSVPYALRASVAEHALTLNWDGKLCPEGKVSMGRDKKGQLICVPGGAGAVEWDYHAKQATEITKGGWIYDAQCWGYPRFAEGSTDKPCAHTQTVGKDKAGSEYIDFKIPTNAKTAFISLRGWKDSGFFDVMLKGKAGLWKFQRRIMAYNDVQHTTGGGTTDGNFVALAATGLEKFTHIRIQNKQGRIYFSGIGFSRQPMFGVGGNGYIDWRNVVNRPVVAYEKPIPAGDLKQSETDNVRANKLADGSKPWTEGDKHNHKYDVNDDSLQRADTKHFVAYGKKSSMVFRTDGKFEYANSGSFPFVWLQDGVGIGNRAMALSKDELHLKGKLTATTGVFVGKVHVARGDQECKDGEQLKGIDSAGNKICAKDKDTTYDGSNFPASNQQCGKGEQLLGFDAKGIKICGKDADTKYDGGNFALSDQACADGEHLKGIDKDGKKICAKDKDTTYSGKDFAVSNNKCAADTVQVGVDDKGFPVCIKDAGLNIDVKLGAKDNSDISTGNWTFANSCWGTPRIAGGDAASPCAFTKTTGPKNIPAKDAQEYLDFKVPNGMRTAFVGAKAWSDSGTFDIMARTKAGLWKFQRRITAHQAVQNLPFGGTHDGNQIFLAATGLENYSHVRVINRNGRLYFAGIGFTRQDRVGGSGMGMVDWGSVVNRPNVAYTDKIPAGDFKQAETDNVRGNKLADGSTPWTDGSKHNHKYDVNSDNIRRADDQHFVLDGKKKSTAFLASGDAEYQSSGKFPWVWLQGGVGAANRAMGLSRDKLQVKGDIVSDKGVLIGKVHVAKGAQLCKSGEALVGIDENGDKVCQQVTVYTGKDFMTSGQKCPVGKVQYGVDDKGAALCIEDSGLNPEWIFDAKQHDGRSTGNWTEDGQCWGQPRFAKGGIDKPCAFTKTAGASAKGTENIDFKVPAGARTAWVSVLGWKDSGHFDIFVKTKSGLWQFQRRLHAYNAVQNSVGSTRDGNVVLLAATGLDSFSHVRLQNRVGRLYFTGIGFGRQALQGGATNGFIDWTSVVNRPTVAYTGKIPADNFNQAETDNVRANKLADGSKPWTDGDQHNHKYDVNSANIKRADDAHFVADGKKKSMVFRADGDAEYQASGKYPFVWLNGGTGKDKRIAGLSSTGLDLKGALTTGGTIKIGAVHVAKGDQKCGTGEVLAGIDENGDKVCVKQQTYDGATFALSNKKCADGEIQYGVDDKGGPLCIKDSGLNIEVVHHGKSFSTRSAGNWTEDASCWGEPRFAQTGGNTPCAFTETKGPENTPKAGKDEIIEFAVPKDMKTAFVAVHATKDSGTFDVFTRTSGGAWNFQRTITAHQAVQTGSADGNVVYLAATGLDHYTHIRLKNRNGRLYFAGLGYTRQDMLGSGSNGSVDWSNVVNRPNVAYTDKIAADDFTQSETDNVRANKLADGSKPWTVPSEHTHSYDVNKDRLQRKDDKNFIVDGKSKQMAFRADGTGAYATGVGAYNFVWMDGGDDLARRIMALSKDELQVKGKITAVNGFFTGSSHVAKGNQSCSAGQQVIGFDANGAVKCVADANTTYSGANFALSNQKCASGEQLLGIDEKGLKVCVTDADTKYDGTDFALSNQQCDSGKYLVGFDKDGKKVCTTDANTQYDGTDFALSNKKCADGEVQYGVNDKGNPLCVKDSGLNVETVKASKDASAKSSGNWTDDLNCWGQPRFAAASIEQPCAFTNTKGKDQAGSEFIDFTVPTGSKSAWVSVLSWSDSGYFDVFTKSTGGLWKFQRRITAHNSVQNVTSGGYDGMQVFLAATGLDHFTEVRLQNRQGRLYFAGIGFSRMDMVGSAGNGFTDWDNIVNRPNVQYTSAIAADKFTTTEVSNIRANKLADGSTPWVEPADDFKQAEVDNVRGNKLADGSTPWKTPGEHTHKYDVNGDDLKRSDTQHFVANGNSKSMVFRNDGDTEYKSSGKYPFVWLQGGTGTSNRAMGVSKTEVKLAGKLVAGTGGVLIGSTHVMKGNQTCASGKVATGVDTSGDIVCKTEITYNGTNFMLADQKCGTGQVQLGVDKDGKVVCIADSGLKVEVVQHAKDAVDKTVGKWTEDANCWGQPRFAAGGGNFPCAYTATKSPGTAGSEFIDFKLPSGMATAYVAARAHVEGGTFDVFTKTSGGTWIYQRSITAYQGVQNGNNGDGNAVFLAATQLGDYTHIRLKNRNGRIHFAGLGYSREEKVGSGNNGHIDWTGVVNRPTVAYTAKIAADDFTQSETDNVRANKLADGSEPWKTGSDHTHKYDVNKDRLERADSQNFIVNGKSKQMAFRADGTAEYATGVGAYNFVWMDGGDDLARRIAALSKEELHIKGKVTAINGFFTGSSHVAKGNQSCSTGQQVIGFDANGAVKCVADANTTYSGTNFALSNQKCAAGEQLLGLDDKGVKICVKDADTTYDGTDFALSNQQCSGGQQLLGFDKDGKKVCVSDANTEYDGTDFALADNKCAAGQVQYGVDNAGKPLCIKDSGLNIETVKASKDASSKSSGNWTDDNNCWGEPRFAAGGIEKPCAFTNTKGKTQKGSEFIDFTVPTGSKTAWVSVLSWTDSGYFDVFTKNAAGWKFQRRITAHNSVQNTTNTGYDGMTVFLAATGLDHFTEVRLQNRQGRLYFAGIGFSRMDMVGGASNGFMDWDSVVNRPNVQYTSTIPADKFTTTETSNLRANKLADGSTPWVEPADDFKQSEVDNVRASKLADGTTPWATGSEHTHKYDVNKDELKRSDSQHFIANGNSKSLVMRTDGDAEYASSGKYPFIWLQGGTGTSNRAAALSKTELTLQGKLVAGTGGVLIGSTHVMKGNQTCGSGKVATGVDSSGDIVCKTEITYGGSNFMTSDQKCGTGLVQQGVDADGKAVCIADVGFKAEVVQHGKDANDKTTGKWTEDANCWGEPRFAAGGGNFPCLYTATKGPGTAGSEFVEFPIPSGMKTAYIAIRAHTDGGTFDVYTKNSSGSLFFQRSITGYQGVQNAANGDGNVIFLAATNLGAYTHIQLKNRNGRIHFAGLGYTREQKVGSGSNGNIDWTGVVNRPNVAYTAKIAADDFTQSETDNVRANKLADGSQPWKTGSDHTHKYDVNKDRLERADSQNFIVNGKSKQIVLRSDGTTEYATGVGAYNFVFMDGGDDLGHRIAALSKTELHVKGKVTSVGGFFFNNAHVAKGGQSCSSGQQVTGIDTNGAVTCATDANTTYSGTNFALSNQQCSSGQQLLGIDDKGVKVCVTDADTKYTGKDFALSNQQCDSGKYLVGFDGNGNKVCVADANTEYNGIDFALSGKACATGEVQFGVDGNGNPRCIKDSGLNIEAVKGSKDASAKSAGGWTDDNSCWGDPKFVAGGSEAPCSFTTTTGKATAGSETMDFAVPTGMKTAWVAVKAWSDSGYFDIFTKTTGGAFKFQRRITAHNSVQNTTNGGHDGMQVFLAATGLDHFTEVRIQNRQGRIYFAGIGFSRMDMVGSAGNGFHDWANIVNRPNVQYTAAIPADKFTTSETSNLRANKLADGSTPWVEPADDFNQTEVDNVRASKLADGTTPWASGSEHTHSYDVNKDELQRSDTKHFVANGNNKSLVMRSDGTAEYASSGAYPFVWLQGGTGTSNRAAALSKTELTLQGKLVAGTGGVLIGSTHVMKGNQTCGSGKVATGVDTSGDIVCKTEVTYGGSTFMTSDQKCGAGLVQQGVDADGKAVCIADVGFKAEVVQHGKDANDKTTGKWTEDANCWGEPRFAAGGGSFPCLFNTTKGPGTAGTEFVEFPVPSGMKTAYIAIRAHTDGGTFDVFTKNSSGTLFYQRSITGYQAQQNTANGDGNVIYLAATQLDSYTHIRLVNRNGRIHFAGLGYTREQKVGSGSNGHIDWTGVVNRPNVAYTSLIAADDFTQSETDNVRANKLADGTTPWATGSEHTHSYDVNKDRLERSDSKNYIVNGKSKQIAWRADGTTEYATGVGAYNFVWMDGGDDLSKRIMALSKTELHVKGKVTSVGGFYFNSAHLAKGNQACSSGQQVTGIDSNGAVQCAADANTTYSGTNFALSNQQCASGQQLLGVDDKGVKVCATDADTKYDGTDFALSNQQCSTGQYLVGFNGSGVKVCAADSNTTYDGSTFALSNKQCAAGSVQYGVDTNGEPLCIKDSSLNIEATLHGKDPSDQTTGKWTVDGNCWGEPKFAAGGTDKPCIYTETTGSAAAGTEFVDFAIPSGMKTAWLSVRTAKDAGHFDVFTKDSSGGWMFQRRVMAYQAAADPVSGDASGMMVVLAATGLDHYTHIRLQNRKGRLYFAGFGFTREDLKGGGPTGFMDWDNVINKPTVAYTSTIPADQFTSSQVTNVRASKLADGSTPWVKPSNDFSQTEVDNLRAAKLDDGSTPWVKPSNDFNQTEVDNIRAAKLDDGSTPWTDGTKHNHQYDVNDAWLRENGDNAHFKAYGGSRQMAFRTDGTTEYASGIGAHEFVWQSGGDASSNTAMYLDGDGTLSTKKYGKLGDYFVEDNQQCADGFVLKGHDGDGKPICTATGGTDKLSGSCQLGQYKRIAENTGGNRFDGTFTLREEGATGSHSSLTFRISGAFNDAANASFTLLNHGRNSTTMFTEVRLVTKASSATFLEVKCAAAGTVSVALVGNQHSGGWVAKAFTSGSVPTGYAETKWGADRLFGVGGSADHLVVERSGYVGISGTPSHPLHVKTTVSDWQARFENGSRSVYIASDTSGMHINTGASDSSSGYVMELRTNNGTDAADYTAMMVTNSRKVGIRTDSPAEALHVNGSIRADSSIKVDGSIVIDDGAGWHRSYGNTGWQNSTHGGGFYMQGTSKIEVFGSKQLYSDVDMQADGGFKVDNNVVVDADGGWFISNKTNTGWKSATHGGGIYMDDANSVKVFGSKDFIVASTDNRVYVKVKDGAAPGLEIRALSGGRNGYIDFSNDSSVDFDARFELTGNDALALKGAGLTIDDGGLTAKGDSEVSDTNGSVKIRKGTTASVTVRSETQNGKPFVGWSDHTSGEGNASNDARITLETETGGTRVLKVSTAVFQVDGTAGMRVGNDTLWKYISDQINKKCHLYFGWGDACDDCNTDPSKKATVRGDGYCTKDSGNTGDSNTCASFSFNDGSHSKTIKMAGISWNDDSGEKDKFWVAFKCFE